MRATGQINDGVMKNCISLNRWERYRHCLDTLTKSNVIISVANSTELKSKGTWTGIVQVGGTGAPSHFEIFDCKGAFNVILGKPWLKVIRAQHDYVTDEITIGKDSKQEVITNILDLDTKKDDPPLQPPSSDNVKPKPQSGDTQATPPVNAIKTPGEDQLAAEWA